jgi:hypothetical protein
MNTQDNTQKKTQEEVFAEMRKRMQGFLAKFQQKK